MKHASESHSPTIAYGDLAGGQGLEARTCIGLRQGAQPQVGGYRPEVSDDGFAHKGWSVLVVIGYIASFALLARALKLWMPVGRSPVLISGPYRCDIWAHSVQMPRKG